MTKNSVLPLFLSRFMTAVILIILASCSPSSIIEIDEVSFDEEVRTDDKIEVVFNNDLASDSLQMNWMPAPFLSFTPEVAGSFRWISANKLEFVPMNGFKPSTVYSLSPGPALERLIGENSGQTVNLEQKFEFHTPWLTIKNVSAIWMAANATSPENRLRLRILFTEPVQQNQSGILLEQNDKAVPFSVVPGESSSELVVDILQSALVSLSTDLGMTIPAGFKNSGGAYQLEKPLERTLTVPPQTRLEILSLTPVIDTDGPTVSIQTNQEVINQNPGALISISPAVNIQVKRENWGLSISGPFDFGQAYSITLSNQLKGPFGSLQSSYSSGFTFATPTPSIRLANPKSLYLSTEGQQAIGLEITAINKVRVITRKIFANNLKSLLNNATDYDYYEDEDGEGYQRRFEKYAFNWVTYRSDLLSVISDEEIKVASMPYRNGRYHYQFKAPPADDFKGMYLVEIYGTDDPDERVVFGVAYSDVGLIVRQDPLGNLTVFTNSLKTAQPMGQVSLTVISHNNQVMATGKTSASGSHTFPSLSENPYRFTPALITAETSDGGYSFISLSETRTDLSRYDVAGFTENETGMMGFINPERNLYRPGEAIRYSVIIRNRDWEPVKKVPFRVIAVLPDGNQFMSERKETDETGDFTGMIPTAISSPTGKWRLEVYSADQILLNSETFFIEEFVPDRILVQTSLNKTSYEPGEDIQLKGTATNYFGPPAAGRKFESELSIYPKPIRSKEFNNYSFDLVTRTDLKFEEVVEEGETGKEGEFNATFNFPADLINIGLLEGRVFTTVFDENGRPVNKINLVNLPTQPYFAGLGNLERYPATNEKQFIPLIAVDQFGKAVDKATLNVKVMRIVWESTLIENQWGGRRFESRERRIVLHDQMVTTTSEGMAFPFTPTMTGSYEVQVGLPGSPAYVKGWFYAYTYGTSGSGSFTTNQEGHVGISADKDTYSPGETARLLFNTPFPGRLLITVEREKLYDHFWVDTDNKAALLDLKIKADFRPNIFISATLFRALDDGSIPVTVAHGYHSIRVLNHDQKLPVEITAVAESRSRTKQRITVKAGNKAGTSVTIAAVDEGILAIKDFRTPDPFNWFFQRRKLQVDAFDMYHLIYPDLTYRTTSAGGDKYNIAKRINPLTARRVKLVSFWSGKLKTNSSGTVSFDIDIPDFSGKLRLMAIAHNEDQFGNAESAMTIADPVVLSTALPRFMAPSDTVLMGVMVSNTTLKTMPINLTIQTDGPLTIHDRLPVQISVPAQSEKQIFVRISAKPVTGTAKVTVTASAGSESWSQQTELSIRPTASYQTSQLAGVVSSGETKTLAGYASEWLPGSLSAQLVVGPVSGLDVSRLVGEVVNYPYGCSEQVTTRGFAMLNYEQLIKTTGIRLPGNQPVPELIIESIRLIESRQTYSGGILLWPGMDTPDLWTSVYAAHFLTEAKRAGYAVDHRILNKLKDFIRSVSRDRENESILYFEGNSTKWVKVPRRVNLYALFVLARDGDPDIGSMNYYRSNSKDLTRESMILLASAYGQNGDQVSFNSLLPTGLGGMQMPRESGQSWASDVRNLAMNLYAIRLVDPSHSSVPLLQSSLNAILKKEKWFSTQEIGFILLAARLANSESSLDYVPVKIAGIPGEKDFRNTPVSVPIKPETAVKLVGGTGKTPTPYTILLSGIPVGTDPDPVDAGMTVRKQFFDRQGKPLSGNQVEQGDLIVFKLTLQNATGVRIDNVVINDLLPAGFEIENPRLKGKSDMSWLGEFERADYLDIRDDRLLLFTHAPASGKMTFYYMVRAVTAGDFKLPGVVAEAMYSPAFRSVTKTERVSVRAR